MSEAPSRERQWLAVRVACVKCGANELMIAGSNLVVCNKCHHQQSFFVDLNQNDDAIVTFPAK